MTSRRPQNYLRTAAQRESLKKLENWQRVLVALTQRCGWDSIDSGLEVEFSALGKGRGRRSPSASSLLSLLLLAQASLEESLPHVTTRANCAYELHSIGMRT